MWESITAWTKFWLGCIRDGLEVGDCIFGFSELALVVLVGWLTYKKRHDLSHYWEDKSVKWVWIILGVAFSISTIFVAPFLKYSDAESSRKEAQAALDDKSPKLKGFVHRIVPLDDTYSTNSTLFIDVSVSNLGETPSDAEEYALKVVLSTNASVTGEELKFTNEYTLNFVHKEQQWLLDLKRPQLIAEKTVFSIPNGEHKRGWLAYRLHGLKTGQYEMTNIIFSFVDNHGNKISVTNGFWAGRKTFSTNSDDIAMVIPGAENIFYPVYPEIRTNWIPPELPADCSNVVVFLGSSGIVYSRLMAKISPEGTKFAIRDLPDLYLQNMNKSPGYSPHLENMWVKWASAQQDYGGKKVDLPVLPLVVSNRLYVEIQIPFSNEKRKLVMSREFDSELSKLPNNWDWNYSTNYSPTYGIFYYEIVNEFTNPVLQVFYTAPNEIHVFGIFIVNTNQLLETFGGPPQLLTFVEKFISKKTGKEITNVREIKKELGTNSIGSIITNYMYGLKFPEAKTIFKYPFNRNQNAFSDLLFETNKSVTKTVDKP